MAFIDEYTFSASAGNGGDGVVRWTREKFRPRGGPCGGDGGRGGDVYLEAVRDTMLLGRILHRDAYRAPNGNPGEANSRHGADGEDLIIRLPIGSVVRNRTTNETVELLHEQQRIKILSGGAGGHGNEHFKSSTNQRPMQCTQGKEGEHATFEVELRLIADVGLVGLPNAGKTSLLNALTNAGAKVGDYPFTTLDPNLGAYHGYIIADIPGLIEGASQGKGLGHKFLRHIARTKLILHIISCERDNIVNDYNVILNELSFTQDIANKRQLIVLSKIDTKNADDVQRVVDELQQQCGVRVFAQTSVIDDASIKKLGDMLVSELRRSDVPEETV